MRRRGVVTASDGTSTHTDYVYDNSMLVEEIIQHFSSSGTALDTPTTITYFQGPQGPLYRKSSAEPDPSWYVYDGLGSVVGEVDVNGNMTATKQFDVYGATRSYTGAPTTRQGFVGGLGHETDDETGLVYMRGRYYDPETGRFISEDPAASGLNYFVYCGDDPANRFDLTGLSPLDDINNILSMAWQTFNNGESGIAEKTYVFDYLEDKVQELKAIASSAQNAGLRMITRAQAQEMMPLSGDAGEIEIRIKDAQASGGVMSEAYGVCAQLAIRIVEDMIYLNMGFGPGPPDF